MTKITAEQAREAAAVRRVEQALVSHVLDDSSHIPRCACGSPEQVYDGVPWRVCHRRHLAQVLAALPVEPAAPLWTCMTCGWQFRVDGQPTHCGVLMQRVYPPVEPAATERDLHADCWTHHPGGTPCPVVPAAEDRLAACENEVALRDAALDAWERENAGLRATLAAVEALCDESGRAGGLYVIPAKALDDALSGAAPAPHETITWNSNRKARQDRWEPDTEVIHGPPRHREQAGECTRCGEPWPCSAARPTPTDDRTDRG